VKRKPQDVAVYVNAVRIARADRIAPVLERVRHRRRVLVRDAVVNARVGRRARADRIVRARVSVHHRRRRVGRHAIAKRRVYARAVTIANALDVRNINNNQ